MDEQKIKNLLSREVLSRIEAYDWTFAQVVRTIIFDDDTKINWNKAYEYIIKFMPELKKYDGYKVENMK